MSTSTHCPTCAAPIREQASKFCAFCGTKLPEPATVLVRDWSPTAPERFAAARDHASAAQMLAFTPSSTGASVQNWFLVAVSCTVAVLGAIFTAQTLADPRAPTWLALLVLAIGVLFTWAAVRRARRFASAPLRRWIAVVVDERVSVSGGEHTTTTNYASFELEDGERFELQVGEELASGIARGDIGVLYSKRGILLGFVRIRV